MAEYKKKLIEVALPLSEINDASAYDKMPGIGPHPKGIHQWPSRKPLPTALAILFASVVDDPSSFPEKFHTEEMQIAERKRLFGIIKGLMQKKMHTHPELYEEAYREILKHCNNKPPIIVDPFAGGGTISLEANRLGFSTIAADLNPVAVLLNKCNLEIVPEFKDHPAVNPMGQNNRSNKYYWKGACGLADDVMYYGMRIREKAFAKIGHLYPKVKLPKDKAKFDEQEADVAAWLWTRTVTCPDPVMQRIHVPLMSSFWLCNKSKKKVFVIPETSNHNYNFKIYEGQLPEGFKHQNGTITRNGARSIFNNTPIGLDHIRKEGNARKLKTRMVAVVAELSNGKTYVSPDTMHEQAALVDLPDSYPDTELPEKALGFRIQPYGFDKHFKCFTNRQLTAIVTLSDLIRDIRSEIRRDANEYGLDNDSALYYENAIVTFLALALDRCVDFNNSLCRWSSSNEKVMNLFGRSAIPMIWNFAEANILGESVGSWQTCANYISQCIMTIGNVSKDGGQSLLKDASSSWVDFQNLLISTDPPYYDMIGYSALSDFFYIWLRRTIGDIYPDIFSTILVPKESELTAAPEKFAGNRRDAKEHFEVGFKTVFSSLKNSMSSDFPMTVYYAFKQEDETENDDETITDDGAESEEIDKTTGWETLLQALIESGFRITATWPIRSEQKWRMRAMHSNALASSIVLACRCRGENAQQCSRREFLNELKKELPKALKYLQQGNIAPVDLAQASIGPGMAIYSRYSQVIESTGKPMSVRTALALINQTLDEVLTGQESEFDADTRWAIAWFEQCGLEDGSSGDANLLCQAKNTSINGLVNTGFLSAKAGVIRLLNRTELKKQWDPSTDTRLTIWEITQYLIKAHEETGESGAAALLKKLGGAGEIARDLAYRLFKICEKKGMSQEAQAYNGLVLSWPEIARLASAAEEKPESEQTTLF